ncbi:MAG: hypothetical protein ACOXZQ_09895 [Bacteroidales bacterium]|nr:hypothetical protein [Bacteroidales bacterium]
MAVVIASAVIRLLPPVVNEPGATSNTEEATPEKAIIDPTALERLFPSENEKDVPSVPSATLYRTVL